MISLETIRKSNKSCIENKTIEGYGLPDKVKRKIKLSSISSHQINKNYRKAMESM